MGRTLELTGTYDADTLKVIGQAYDEAWQSIAGNFGSPQAAETARQQLATIILGLAPSSGEIRDVELMKYSALVAMRLRESISESIKQARADVAKELKWHR